MQKFKEKGLNVKHLNPTSLTFSIFTPEDIEKLSVVNIITPLSFNALGHPLKGGLYDPALGPISESSMPCATCSNNVYVCPGHLGHIKLPLPVVNPLFHRVVFNILKLACLECHTLQVKGTTKQLFITKLKLLEEGLVTEALEAEDLIASFNLSENKTANSETEYLAKEKLEEYLLSKLGNKERNTISTSAKTKLVESVINNLVNIMDKPVTDKKLCWNCRARTKRIKFYRNRLLTAFNKQDVVGNEGVASKLGESIGKRVMASILPDESKNHLRKIWNKEQEFVVALAPVLKNCAMEHPTDALFLDVVPVPPPKVRPVNFVGNRMVEHPQSQTFKLIIQECMNLRHVVKAVQDGDTSNLAPEGKNLVEHLHGGTLLEKMHIVWQELQVHVNTLMDCKLNPANKHPSPGIKQVIEKKEGVIRMHMMGKRVNFAARSVIAPDPYLNIEEIGIPEVFATSLTYPVPVTVWNVAELRKMVTNGPLVHPGAVMVQNEDGTMIKISATDPVQRESIAKRLLTPGDVSNVFKGIKRVHRHLCNGDMLLLNRQPTLHRPSIMAHTARILKGEKTLRLHYANCKAYNADFDGDEMNAHFPQNELARSEAYNLLNVKNQYLVPKDGTPLSGLIQDHVVSGVRLSVRGRFFNKEEYQQLVYQGLSQKRGEIKLLPPAILKPYPCWSGKQIISTVIINIIPKGQHPLNLNSTAKINDRAWVVDEPREWMSGGTPFSDASTMSEAEVIIREGELLCGVLDKNHYGATCYGLVHCMYELYGGTCSSSLLSAFARLFNAFLQREGFSLGVEDILVVEEADRKRTNIIAKARKIGNKAIKSAINLPEMTTESVMKEKIEDLYQNEAQGRAIIDSSYKSILDEYTNKINKVCLPSGLLKTFPDNNLQLMIQSGAKGSTVNSMQISCLLGQIELEGKRPPHMISGKTLPSFAQYDTSPRAGGFVDGRFMTGIKPQEFFHHCMAGREGLIDTAVKTSRSGYLQRCLVKHLEGLVVGYDMTVRDSDGSVVQFYYGEDGRDVMKAQFLKKAQIPFLAENSKVLKNVAIDSLLDHELSSQITEHKKRIDKWQKKNGNPFQKNRMSPFAAFSVDMKNNVSSKMRKINAKTGRSKPAEQLCQLWRELDSDAVETYKNRSARCPDPVIAKFQGGRDFGALTEQLDKLMNTYLKERHIRRKSEFREIMSMKSIQSHCFPGEPVGLLAAQSIGEPSTQMTLNTFHFAGRGEMNVTLGIPRLRELLMTASKRIKTPNMDIPFHSDIRNLEKKANKLKLKLCRVTVADVLQHINITDKLDIHASRQQLYQMHFQFLPYKAYKSKFCVRPADILQYTEKQFFKNILVAMKKVLKFKGTVLQVESEKHSKGSRGENDEDEEAGLEEQADVNLSEKAKKSGVGEEHESSDEEEEGEDDDATMARSRLRHTENQEYEEPEDDEAQDVNSEDEGIEENRNKDTSEGECEIDDDVKEKAEDPHLADDDELFQKRSEKKKEQNYELRRSRVVSSMEYIKDYDYDTKEELWCKIVVAIPWQYRRLDLTSLLKDVASKSVIWEVPEINRAITYINPNTQCLTLKTEGINFLEMFKFQNLLDLNRLYSNNVHRMADTFGIEAARRVIVKEIQDVFKVYGIVVDPRHLLLVADFMTFSGTYKPFSRKSFEDNVSPLQQMSFESSTTFLKMAITRGKRDDLVSPSSRLMVGQPIIGGTGSFTLLHRGLLKN